MRRGKLLKSGLTSLLAVTLAVGLLPTMPSNTTTVYASETTTTDKTIAGLGTDVIDGPASPASTSVAWKGNYVYFGTYNKEPVKYRVLDAETTDYSAEDEVTKTKAKTMLLDCDSILYNSKFDSTGNTWASSATKTYLNGEFLTKNFSVAEQNAIASSSKTGTAANGCDAVSLDNDRIFVLEMADVINVNYGYSNTNAASVANRVKNTGFWWTRSATAGLYNNKPGVGIVNTFGELGPQTNDNGGVGVSPALNVNLSSVLFSSLVDDTTAGQTGATYKLTLFDDAMTVAQNGTITRDDGTITIPYTITGADSKNATQVSVLLLSRPYTVGNTNGAAVYYYGALNTDSFSESGEGTFTLPTNLLAKNCGSDYYAYIIAEDVNGTKETDYASTPVAITIEKEEIGSVAVIDIEAPTATKDFDTVASCRSKGVGTAAPTVTWTPTSATGKAAFNTPYTASVTLSPADGYVFTANTAATVDGNDATSVTKNSNGTLTITYTFGTTTANRTIAGLGTSMISDPTPPSSASDEWKGNYVYFGSYYNQPVKYRVLDAETTDFSADKTTKTMLLDCDSALLDTNGKVWVSVFDSSTKVWSNSAIRTYLNGTFLTSGFTSAEQSTIAYSTKNGKSVSDGPGDTQNFSFAQMSGDRIFLLDAMEATNKSYGYSENSGKAANRLKSATTGSYAIWWLRSPNRTYDGCAAHVGTTGHIGSIGVKGEATVGSGSIVAVCPAFNLDLSKVLFSAVVSDASSTGTAYELTVIDSDMTIALNGEVTRSGNTVTVPYTITGNNSGKATQVSVLLLSEQYSAGNANNAEILYYGALNAGDFSTTGTGTFVLPESVLAKSCGSGYYAYIIAEDLNGTALTDYASAPVSIDIGKAEIDSVAVTDITAPTAGHALDVGASTSTSGIDLTTPTVTWKQGDTAVTGNAGYLATYTASVTLTADGGHEFATNVTATVNGQNATSVVKNADGTLTVSYTFATTEKRTVSSVGNILIPNAVEGADGSKSGTFTEYHTALDVTNTDATSGNTELEKMATVTFADGESGDVAITWTVEGTYQETPEAENTFRWTLPDTYNYADGVASTGTFTMKNKAATPVTITAKDESFDYDSGATIDVSTCFTIDSHAGTASYALVTDDTATDAGAGTLDGATLTVSKVGTFQVKVTTAANGNYAAGEDIAKITVNPGAMQCVVTDYTCTYDGQPHTLDDQTFTIPEGATITYSSDGSVYNAEKPTFIHVGSYPVYYQIEKENFTTITGTKYVTIQARPLTVTANRQEITYGSTISQTGYTSTGLATGDSVLSVTLTPSTALCTHNGTITVGNVKVTNGSEDVTADYDIAEVPGTLVIEHNDEAPVTSISAFKQKVSYVLGDTLNVDDISVYGTCEDGCSEPVTSGFTVDTSEVDMRSIGDKTLKVSFRGYTAEIAIVVQPKTVTVTVQNCSKHMDAADPAFAYTAEGLLDGDSLKEITYTRESGEVPGDYVITASAKEGANPNYTLHFQIGKLTIEDHEWSGTWTVTREATTDKEGIESTSCNVCGQTRTRTIAKTGTSTETADAQKIEKSVEIGTNSTIKSAEITSTKDTLKEEVLNTENLSDITEPRVWIEVSDAKNLSSTVETKFETKAAAALSKNVDEILYTDINLYKSYTQNATKTTTQVTTQLNEAIEISLLVPVNMRNTNSRVTRTYQVLRMHDSQVDAIDSTYDASNYMLTFQTDRFSTYAIAYADTTVSSGGGSTGGDISGSIIGGGSGSAGGSTGTITDGSAGSTSDLISLILGGKSGSSGKNGKSSAGSGKGNGNTTVSADSDTTTGKTGKKDAGSGQGSNGQSGTTASGSNGQTSGSSADAKNGSSNSSEAYSLVKTATKDTTEVSKTVKKQLQAAVEQIKKVDAKIQEGPFVTPKISGAGSDADGAKTSSGEGDANGANTSSGGNDANSAKTSNGEGGANGANTSSGGNDADGEVQIQVEIPSDLLKENRTFYLMSVDADGNVIVLQGQVSEDGTLTVIGDFDADATYQILYEDIEENDVPLAEFLDEGGQLFDANGNTVTVDVTTSAGIGFYRILAVVAVVIVGLFILLLWKRRRDNETKETK